MKKQFLSLAIRYAGKSLAVCLFLILFAGNSFAANTYDWVGTNSTDWATPQNWKKNGATQFFNATYPAQSASNDIVRIGTNSNFATANSPVLSTTLTRPIASLEFGDNNGVAMTLTINTGFTLTITNDITQDHYGAGAGIITTITGQGAIICTGFIVGDGTTPSKPTNAAGTDNTYLTVVNCSISSLTITGGTLTLESESRSSNNGNWTNFNNPVFNLNSGSLSLNNIKTTNGSFSTGNTCAFNMGTGSATTSLTLLGTTPFSFATGGTVDFLAGGTASASTVIYGASASQTIYTSSDANFNIAPTMYPNLTFSGGNKTIHGATLSVGGDWTTGGTGTINLTSSDPVVNVSGDWTNTSTTNLGAGALSVTGNLNNNGGTISGNNATTATITGILNNSGSISSGADNMTFTAAAINTGTYTGGSGTTTFTAGLTNTGTVNESSGTFTIGNLANNSGGIFKGYTSTATTNITGTFSNAGTITANKENITCTGAATNTGTFTGGTGNTTFNGTFTMTAGTFATGTGDVTFNDDYGCSGGTFTGNSGDVIFKAGYSNTGTGIFNGPTTGNTIVSAAGNQTFTDNSSATGTIMTNAQFQGGGTKTLAGTKGFFISSAGTLTLSGNTTLAAGGVLTLNSDGNGSAIVAPIPTGCSITGNVNVQRFIEGSLAANRGYRLMTSTVFTGSPGGINVYDLDYLKNTLWVSGPGYAANGFNVTTTQNPSIYLFREDVAPPQSTTINFTTGYNWKGVAKINNSPLYNIGTQAKTTTTNINDFTTTIPVGNGILVFDRGDKTAGTAGKTVAPFIAPGDVTVTEIGQLNTGNITVIPWYTGGTPSFTYTASSTGPGTLIRGFALVGNPYPATINWEKYNNTNITPSSPISGTVSATIYEFNNTTKQYGSYTAIKSTSTTEHGTGTTHYTNGATNYIASGMGFFVVSTAPGQTLTFTENAKISTNGSATFLKNLMGKPKETAEQPVPYVRLKLITDSVNNDDIVIGFDNKASDKFVDNEDVIDIGGSGAPESLSSFSTDSIALAINMLPLPGKQQKVIGLMVDATASGTYQLAIPEFGDMPKLYSLLLKDAFTGDSVEVKLNTTYPFTIDKGNAATFGNKRFSLVIRQDSAYAYKLLDFTATKTNYKTDVQLVWKTQNEENNTRFTVERSTNNGRSFEVIGSQTSTGTGNYSLVDKHPDRGQNLYRLKQVDLNNTVTYSKPVRVQFSDRGNSVWDRLSIYPNPASHSINLAINDQYDGNASYTIRFMNSYGMVIKQINCTDAEWHGNVSNLRPGTYLVRVFNNRNQKLVGENKFVKL